MFSGFWGGESAFSRVFTAATQLLGCRLKELADKEQDVDKKMGLRKVFRSLQGVRTESSAYTNACCTTAGPSPTIGSCPGSIAEHSAGLVTMHHHDCPQQQPPPRCMS